MQFDWLYTLSDPLYYEDIARYPTSSKYVNAVQAMLPQGWTTTRSSVWLHVNHPEAVVPTQGFKIHVSSTNAYALDVVAAIAPECIDRQITFKIAADQSLLSIINSKLYNRGGSGKFMTIYPPSEEAFISLMQTLYERTIRTSFVGPYILSDRRYKDSRILFYRYGGFRPIEALRIDGTTEQLLVTPEGATVRDVRTPYYDPPVWVKDPFGDSSLAGGEASIALNDRFLVESVLSYSNRGGVYTAIDSTNGQPVVIKEARPNINRMWANGRSADGTDFVQHEYEILQRLAPLGYTPAPVKLFWEWEHLFLAQERIEGVGLKQYLTQTDSIMTPYIHVEGVLDAYLPKFRQIMTNLINAIDAIHDCDVILGDLSLTNVMINPQSLRVTIIDLESAFSVGMDDNLTVFLYNWFTPGFERPGRGGTGELTVADDYYALGIIAFSMLMPGTEFFYLKPDAKVTFLDRLIELGLPLAVRRSIEALLASNVCGAMEALTELPAYQP